MMRHVYTIFKREFASYFTTPVAYVYVTIFLIMQGIFTFHIGQFFEREQADLTAFFTYHPWLYLFLVPSIAMRLWSEDLRNGTIELLLTLPVPTGAVVAGKYLASVVFTGFALFLTFPIWLTVTWLGDPDNGVILTGYIGSLLMACAYLAIGSALSAMTRNQVVAFILAVTVCFLFVVSGMPIVLGAFEGWVPDAVMLMIANLSFLTHYSNLQKGVINLADIVYFVSVIVFWLWVNRLAIEWKREGG